MARRAANPLAELAGLDRGDGRRLSADELAASLALQYGAFPGAAGRLRDELGQDAPMADAIEAFAAGAGLAPGPARRARQALHAIIEAESAGLAASQSLRWMWNEAEYGGDYFGDMPDGGYRRLAEAMAAGADVHLGAEVTEVACSARGARAGPSAGASCSRGSIPRAPGWPTPTARWPAGSARRSGCSASPACASARRETGPRRGRRCRRSRR